MKTLTLIIKGSSAIVALGAQLTPFIPDTWSGWAVIAFMAISTVKDKVLLPIGDKLDDGKLNGSFRG